MDFFIPQRDRDLPRRRSALAARRQEYAFTTFSDLPIGESFHRRDKAGPRWVKDLLAVIYSSRRNLERYLEISGRRFTNPLPRTSAARLAAALWRKDFTALLGHYLPDMGCEANGGRARSIAEYRQVFQKEPLPRIADVFMEDWVFARSFVAGPNPVVLRRLDEPSPRLPITEDVFHRARDFDDDSLFRAIGEGRVFVADYAGLGQLRPGVHPQRPKHVYRPLVMLAVPRGRTSLAAVAIAAGPQPDARVWTPSDGWSWQMAKLAVRVADGCHQELLTHLAFTHLVIEPFVLATRRCLSETHPLHGLLEPHFEGTMPINALAVKKLLQPGEAVDRVVGADIPSIYELLKRERLSFSFAAHHVPADLAARGVNDATRLPDYPYRDDALALWLAIRRWVSGYLDHYYPDDAALMQDDELRQWAAELSDPSKGAIRDLGRDGRVPDVATLKDVAAMIIFTASAQHAAANFAQKTDMAFAPAHPLAGYAPLPTAGAAVTEADFLDMLPPLDVALRTEQTLIFLGSLHYGRLGHYPARRFTAPAVVELMRRFRDDLRIIESSIVARNQGLVLPYIHLQPSRIPQSINI
jgi:arachidonate 15-lipoxygenase